MHLEGGWRRPLWNTPFRLFFNNAADRRAGDGEGLGNLAEALSLSAVPKHGGTIDIQRPAADVAAFQFGPAHTGPYPFEDQVPLQLGDRADDDNDVAPTV